MQLFFLYKTYHRTHPICFCGFFTLIATVLRSISSAVSALSTVSCLSVLCSPLDYTNIIPQIRENVNRQCCTNFQRKNGEKYTKCTKRRATEVIAPPKRKTREKSISRVCVQERRNQSDNLLPVPFRQLDV